MTAAPPTGAELAVRGLARRFGPRWALAGLTFDVPAGRTLLLTGANGSGKTTLLRCLSTALRPHAGTIALDGADTWTQRATCRASIGFLSHQTRLYEDLSAADNLRVWASLGGQREDPRPHLERVGLPPNRRDPVRTFSAGMRRRLALATALLRPPRLMLFDEPLASLDADGQALILKVVADLRARGATIVIASHHPATFAAVADASIHLDAGRIVA